MTYCIVCPSQRPRWFYEETAREYEKRLSRICKILKIRGRIPCHALTGKGSAPVTSSDLVILLSANGTYLSSEDMAERLKTIEYRGGFNRVIFSFESEFFPEYDEIWTLTSVSLPADLQKVLLLEQIYRTQKIIHNEPYHK